MGPTPLPTYPPRGIRDNRSSPNYFLLFKCVFLIKTENNKQDDETSKRIAKYHTDGKTSGTRWRNISENNKSQMAKHRLKYPKPDGETSAKSNKNQMAKHRLK